MVIEHRCPSRPPLIPSEVVLRYGLRGLPAGQKGDTYPSVAEGVRKDGGIANDAAVFLHNGPVVARDNVTYPSLDVSFDIVISDRVPYGPESVLGREIPCVQSVVLR